MISIIYNSLVAGLATLVGAFIVLILDKTQEKLLAWMLGLASGVMLTVSIMDLLPSAYKYSNFITIIMGFFLGIILLAILDKIISNFSLSCYSFQSSQGQFLKMGYLIAIGIGLHNFPEGMAIAVGYSATEHLGIIIALAIGLHNIPEGMATAAPLKIGGVSNLQIIFTILLISLATPLGAYIGLMLINISYDLIGLLLALAAGAMTFIVVQELCPQAFKKHKFFAFLGILTGILLIFFAGFLA